MRARAAIVAELDDAGRTRCPTLRSAPPLTLRLTAGAGATVHLVGSAAGPLGGDDLRLDVTVGPGAALAVRSVAASLAQPGPSGAPSRYDVEADVAPGGRLDWRPEPTVLVRGCDHRATARVHLEDGAELVWREVVVLGRHDEEPGSLLQRLRVDVDGRPLLRTDLPVGPRHPASLGPAGVAGARAIGTALVVGPGAKALTLAPPATDDDVRAAVMPLNAGTTAALVTVVADRAQAALATLTAALA